MPRIALLLCLIALARPASALSWSTVSTPTKGGAKKNFGVTQKASAGSGKNIAVLFGGYKVTDAQVRTWVEAMVDTASPSLKDFNVGTVYAVPGPGYANISNLEIKYAEIAKAVSDDAKAKGSKLIIVAGHSSGAAVAELTVAAIDKAQLSKVVYYRLDGAGGLSKQVFAKLGGGFCVAAKCGKKLISQNQGACYGPKLTKLVLNTPNSCSVGWCCHMALINTAPKTTNTGDPADYTTFDGSSKPSAGWLDQSASKLKGIAGIP
jgi:hypothetical protein